MTFRECIRQHRIIDVDLSPIRNVVWTGVCVKDNGNIAVFINLDEDRKRFDGFTVLRSKEITRYRLCGKSECRGVNRRRIADYLGLLKLRKMVDVPSSLRAAATQSPIAFFAGDETHSYWVGNLVSLSKDQARFRLISKKAVLTRYKTIRTENITFFSFGSEYEKRLVTRLEKRRSNQRHQPTRLPRRQPRG